MSDNIPIEIQTEIIKKVSDVKSLIRFRSVSKPWKSFIDSSEFISGYGTRDTQPHSLLLRYIDNVHPSEVKYVSFVDDVSFPQQQLDFAPNVSGLVKRFRDLKVIGSSCGLWCLHTYKNWPTEMVVIWNPSIRKSVCIAVPCVLTRAFGTLTHFGFGVCPSTYDPTIVKISYLDRKDTDKWHVEIFTLSSKTWKMISSSNLPRESITFQFSTQVAIDKFIYWLSCDKIVTSDDGYNNNNKNFILSFNLITREFKKVNLPPSLENHLSLHFSVSKLSDSLVVSAYTYEVGELVYNVWIMGKEGGVITSFTKLLTINTPFPASRKLLGFRMSGEPIMETKKENEGFATVEVYKPYSGHINDLGINGEIGSFFICPYTETLLLVDHTDGCIISNDY
ncbi:putative F-box domain-containing protein [Tanacetum coccineum]